VKALRKKQTILEDRIASDANYFHRIQTAKKFVYASCERIMPLLRDFSAHLQNGSAEKSVILCCCMSSTCKRYLIEAALKRPQMLTPK